MEKKILEPILVGYKEYSSKHKVKIHAWVLMTNHVHLLCTPMIDNAVSVMMQSLGRMYVRYFNHTYRRTGTLWEGWYKSCLVSADDPADYVWSSYQCNALGKKSELHYSHDIYLRLGDCSEERMKNYRSLFGSHVDGKLLDDIRKASNKSSVLGNNCFVEQLEKLSGEMLREGKPGRPARCKIQADC